MSRRIPPIRAPLRYTMTCSVCRGELDVCPDELDDKLAICPHCGEANPTPIHAVLIGGKGRIYDQDETKV